MGEFYRGFECALRVIQGQGGRNGEHRGTAPGAPIYTNSRKCALLATLVCLSRLAVFLCVQFVLYRQKYTEVTR
jgi:hypothetical protein